MSQYALVSEVEPLDLSLAWSDSGHASVAQEQDVREALTSIYESYAVLYPNPRLAEEAHERDRLLRAVQAASHAADQTRRNAEQEKRQKSAGFFSSLFGGSNREEVPPKESLDKSQDSSESMLVYTDLSEDDEDDSLCGTGRSLDQSCIPQEAHSLARFRLASTRTHGERPNLVRSYWDKPDTSSSGVLVIVGLGLVAEFVSGESKGRMQQTSDRNELQGYAARTGSPFEVAYARGVSIGPNTLIVSWGLSDGFSVLYRRCVDDGKGRHATWEAVAVLGPTRVVTESLADDVFAEEESGSALLRITDLVPLVVETGNIPAVTLAVGRLGGHVELVPLPSSVWYGPEIQPTKLRRRPRGRGQQQAGHVIHYADGVLPNLATSQTAATSFATLEYHVDVITLGSFRTSVHDGTAWNEEAYPNTPPGEYILAASGTRDGNEVLSFWSVSFLFADSQQPGEIDEAFNLHVSLTEAIDLGPVGPDVSIFASRRIMKHWRHPRQVNLRPEESSVAGVSSSAPTESSEPVTSVTVPSPVVALRFVVLERSVNLAVMDWNGSVTLLDCSPLERIASQTLSSDEYDRLFRNQDPQTVAPIVYVTTERPRFVKLISDSARLPSRALSVEWLSKRWTAESSGEPLLALLTDRPSKIRLVLATKVENESVAGFVAFAGSCRGLIGPSGDGELSLLTFDEGENQNRRLLSLFSLQKQDTRHVIESLMQASQYEAAMEAARSLSVSEQKQVEDLLDTCRKRIWETSRDFDSLASLSDDSYIVEAALTLSKNSLSRVDLDLFRRVYMLALRKASGKKYGWTVAVSDLEGTHGLARKIKDCLVKLGTYELLCRYLGKEPSLSEFCSNILELSMKTVAAHCAVEGDVLALTIICFRHRPDIVCDFQVLDSIPVVVPVCDYQHLLPVSDSNESILFQPVAEKPELLDWTQMPGYATERFGVGLVLDDDDRQLVAENCSDSDMLEKSLVLVSNKSSLEEWFTKRAKSILHFGGSLNQSVQFCRLALSALRLDLMALDHAAVSTKIQELTCSMQHAEMLNELLLGSVGSGDLSLSLILPEEIERMDLVDIVGVFLKAKTSPVELLSRSQFFLRSVLTMRGKEQTDLDEAIMSCCLQLIPAKTADPKETSMLLRAVDVCAGVASLSRTSAGLQTRLVRSKKVLIDLALSVFDEVRDACGNCFHLSYNDTLHVVNKLWTMYESLPAKVLPEFDDDEIVSMLGQADMLFSDLVVCDIISKWPGLNAFKFVVADSSVEARKTLGSKQVSALCASFTNQLGSDMEHASLDDQSRLLSSLLSDIDEINRVCYKESLDVSQSFTESLFSSLVQQGRFELAASLLTRLDGTKKLDRNLALQIVVHFVNDAVLGSSDETVPLSAVLMCQDLLGPWFPELQDEFLAIRRYVDASHFIRSVIMEGRRVEGYHPDVLRNMLPLDVIESIIAHHPESILCDCKEWLDHSVAERLNSILREYFSKSQRGLGDESTFQEDKTSLPPLPGRAIYHLAHMLDLNEKAAMITVKCRVVHHALAARLYPAAAAVCLVMLHEDGALDISVASGLVMRAIADTVSEQSYTDDETKRDLCSTVLARYNGRVESDDSVSLDRMLSTVVASTGSSLAAPNRSRGPFASINRLVIDVRNEYNVDLSEFFVTMREQGTNFSFDDSLLCAASKYIVYWCVGVLTRPTVDRSAVPDIKALAALASSLLLQIKNQDISQECLREVRAVLDRESEKVLSQESASQAKKPDEAIVRRLVGRGYTVHGARRAASISNNFEEALQWAVLHSLDADFDSTVVVLKSPGVHSVDAQSISTLAGCLSQTSSILEGEQTLKSFLGSVQPDALISSPLERGPEPSLASSLSTEVPSRTNISAETARGASPLEEEATRAAVSTQATSGESPFEEEAALVHAPKEVSSVETVETGLETYSELPVAQDTFQVHSDAQPSPEVLDEPQSTQPSVETEAPLDGHAPRPADVCTPPPPETITAGSSEETSLRSGEAGAGNESDEATKNEVAEPPPPRNERVRVARINPPRGTPERARLQERGRNLFRKTQRSKSPSGSERQRLIEQGRRLLQKTRALNGSNVHQPTSGSPPGDNIKEPTRADSDVSMTAGPDTAAVESCLQAEPEEEDNENDGWDFDEDLDLT